MQAQKKCKVFRLAGHKVRSAPLSTGPINFEFHHWPPDQWCFIERKFAALFCVRTATQCVTHWVHQNFSSHCKPLHHKFFQLCPINASEQITYVYATFFDTNVGNIKAEFTLLPIHWDKNRDPNCQKVPIGTHFGAVILFEIKMRSCTS